MHYLDVDLNAMCWSKLDYSGVSDISKVVLLDKPLVFDNLREKIEFGKQHLNYIMYNVEDNTMAVLCYANQEECDSTEQLEMGKLIMSNLVTLSMLLNSRIIFSGGIERVDTTTIRVLGGYL